MKSETGVYFMPIRLNFLPIILSLITIALLYPETILSQSVPDSQKKNFYDEMFDIVPDTIENSKILVLGSKHLSRIDDSVEPEMLDSLLELLEEFDPSLIGVEKMSPDLIAAMKVWGGGHEQVLEMMAGRTIRLGRMMQSYLEINQREAANRAGSLSEKVKAGAKEYRGELIGYQIASYDLYNAILQWTYLREMQNENLVKLPDEVVDELDELAKNANEIMSIGVRLAVEQELDELALIDDHTEKGDFIEYEPKYREQLQGNREYEKMLQSDAFLKGDAILEESLDEGDLLPHFLYMNSFEFQKGNVHSQWGMHYRVEFDDNLGRARVALWEARNLKMAAHIRQKSALHAGENILIIVGASHKPYLDAYLKELPDVELLHLNEL